MDKKTLLGLLIIGVILFSFSWYNSKQQSQFDEAKTLVDSLNAALSLIHISEPTRH